MWILPQENTTENSWAHSGYDVEFTSANKHVKILAKVRYYLLAKISPFISTRTGVLTLWWQYRIIFILKCYSSIMARHGTRHPLFEQKVIISCYLFHRHPKHIQVPCIHCCWSCSPPAAEYTLAQKCQFWQPTFPWWLRVSWERADCSWHQHLKMPYRTNGLFYPICWICNSVSTAWQWPDLQKQKMLSCNNNSRESDMAL